MAKIKDPIAELFNSHIEKKNFSSGFLLTGEENEKKKQVASRFAKALNCEMKQCAPDCICVSCKKIESGNHPDVRWYGLDEEERSIKIESVRELQEWLNLKPYEGRVKVFLLNAAERLTTDAQNALLKSLEEPPPNSVFILLTTKRSELLETVVSRLQTISVPPFAEEEMFNLLLREGVYETEARFLSRYASGNSEYAKALHKAGWFRKKNDFLKRLIESPVTGLDQIAKLSRKEIAEYLNLLRTWLRDAAIVKTSAAASLLRHEDLLDELKSFSKNSSIGRLIRLYEKVELTQKALDENANMKLAMTKLEVDWKEFSHGK